MQDDEALIKEWVERRPSSLLGKILHNGFLSHQSSRLESDQVRERQAGLANILALGLRGQAEADRAPGNLDAAVNLCTFYGTVFPAVRELVNGSRSDDGTELFEKGVDALVKLRISSNRAGRWTPFMDWD